MRMEDFNIYLVLLSGKIDNWGKVAQSAGVFHIIVVLPIARERGNPLPDNIKIHQIDNC